MRVVTAADPTQVSGPFRRGPLPAGFGLAGPGAACSGHGGRPGPGPAAPTRRLSTQTLRRAGALRVGKRITLPRQRRQGSASRGVSPARARAALVPQQQRRPCSDSRWPRRRGPPARRRRRITGNYLPVQVLRRSTRVASALRADAAAATVAGCCLLQASLL